MRLECVWLILYSIIIHIHYNYQTTAIPPTRSPCTSLSITSPLKNTHYEALDNINKGSRAASSSNLKQTTRKDDVYLETGSSSSYSPNSSSSTDSSPRSMNKIQAKGPRSLLSYKEAANRAKRNKTNTDNTDTTSYMNIVLAQIGV